MTVEGLGLAEVGMDEGIIFDQIKRKESDFIHALQNIAEAAFITESLQQTGNAEEDSEDLDSDLSKVAREIATTNHMDDNSDPDFEDVIDDAEEINDFGQELLGADAALENYSHSINPEEPQTVIKQDIMEQITNTEVGLHNHCEENNQEKLENNSKLLEANPSEQQEQESEGERGDSTGSWKIDYIRVETEEKERAKTKAVRNEIWSTSKSKKERTRKKHHSLKRSSKTSETEGTTRKNSDTFSFPSETIASRLDKNSNVRLKSKSKFKSSKKSSVRKEKLVENWKDILNISKSQGSDLDQVLENVIDSYSPTVPRGTSQSCIKSLSDLDLELLPCPACKDKFFLPTTFFQHILRRSVQINYNCKSCGEVIVFHNKCSLKIHILNHLESDNITKVETDMLDVVSLPREDLKLNSDVRNVTQELRSAMTNVSREMSEEMEQCPECFKSLERDGLQSHFSQRRGEASVTRCEDCQMVLPTDCSYFAHRRIHQAKSPYVCPECGSRFFTLSYFKSHVTESCLHQRRVLLSACPSCPSFRGSRSEVLVHLAESHCKQYWKCSLCPSAFVDKERSLTHLRDKHPTDHGGSIEVLYKIKYKSQSLFFSSKSSLISHLEQSLDLTSVFSFSCPGCELETSTSQDLLTHLQARPACRSLLSPHTLFPPEKEQEGRYREIMDNLKVIQHETDCSNCLMYNENFQKHIEKHQRRDKESQEAMKQMAVREAEDSSRRVTRRMKRSISSEPGDTPSVVRAENISQHLSPPLKLRIRLKPEVSKAVEPQSQPPVEAPTPTAVVPIVRAKREEKKGKKGSKVKFNVPEPLVEPLGVDVCSGKDLILLNRLFHSPEAFSCGSVVRAESDRRAFTCSHCNLTETDRSSFLSHISQHKSCQSYFQCLECGSCFAAEPSWRKHLLLMHRIKDPGPHLYCQPLDQDLGFSSEEDSLSEAGNLVIDTGEEMSFPGQVPTCLACGQTFSSSGLLRQHKCGPN